MHAEQEAVVAEYVRNRLRIEVNLHPRGGHTKLAKALGISGAYLSNIIADPPTRPPGQKAIEGAAAYFGMTVEKLVETALAEAEADAARPRPGLRSVNLRREDPVTYLSVIARILEHKNLELSRALGKFFTKHHDEVARHVVREYMTRPHQAGQRTEAKWHEDIMATYKRHKKAFDDERSELGSTDFSDE